MNDFKKGEKHPAEDFWIATRDERALRMADMPPMISILPEHVPALLRAARERAKIIPFRRPSGNREHPAR